MSQSNDFSHLMEQSNFNARLVSQQLGIPLNTGQTEHEDNAAPGGQSYLGSLYVHPAMFGLRFTAIGARLYRQSDWERLPNIGPVPRHALSVEWQMVTVRRMVDAYMDLSAAMDNPRYLGHINLQSIELPASDEYAAFQNGQVDRIEVEAWCWKLLEELYKFYDFGSSINSQMIETLTGLKIDTDDHADFDRRIQVLVDHLKAFKSTMKDIQGESGIYRSLARAPSLMWEFKSRQRTKQAIQWWHQAKQNMNQAHQNAIANQAQQNAMQSQEGVFFVGSQNPNTFNEGS